MAAQGRPAVRPVKGESNVGNVLAVPVQQANLVWRTGLPVHNQGFLTSFMEMRVRAPKMGNFLRESALTEIPAKSLRSSLETVVSAAAEELIGRLRQLGFCRGF